MWNRVTKAIALVTAMTIIGSGSLEATLQSGSAGGAAARTTEERRETDMSNAAHRHPRDADYPFSEKIDNIQVHAADTTTWDTARSALTKFAEAELELPELTLWMHGTRHGCSREPGDLERSGVLVRFADKIVIHSCGTEFTVLHELAHAHDIGFLDDKRRQKFMDTRKATAWSGVEWRLAGGEHAADVIAWALLDGEIRPSRTLPNDNKSLELGFEILTSDD